jgi:uncharacterized protein (DUF1800 family)
MVEFWTNHFSIAIDKVNGLKVVDDREVIRKHALGKFPDMLRASAYSPAMIVYLDTYGNYVGAPNQNYARELMELHTLGVDGGYTQQDVVEVARCFTGWSYNYFPPNRGEFVFQLAEHDRGAKTVLGHTIPAGGGLEDGDRVLDILTNHPSTMRFIAKKMCRWLLSYDPSDSLVEDVAAIYQLTGGDIKLMIDIILQPRNLLSAPPKLKRPFHLATSVLRACNATVTDWVAAWQYLYALGQVPFNWIPPNGYPDAVNFWSGLLLPRWDFVFSLFNDEITGASVDTAAWQNLGSAGRIVDRLSLNLFGGQMPKQDMSALLAFLEADPADASRVRDAVALALVTPAFQWY